LKNNQISAAKITFLPTGTFRRTLGLAERIRLWEANRSACADIQDLVAARQATQSTGLFSTSANTVELESSGILESHRFQEFHQTCRNQRFQLHVAGSPVSRLITANRTK
jgi:hypothetical protein